MIGKKINQLATELAPTTTDLTIIGDPISGVSKKITLEQLGAIFGGAVSFYTTLGDFPATGVIDIIYCAKDTKKLYLWSGSAYVEVFPSQSLLDTYQLRSEKGVSNGYASLDSSGKVPISQLPNSIMEYKGTWSAATNTPTLANGTGDTGDVYICNAAGTVNFGAGPLTFAVGDYVVYSGTIWQRSSGAVGTVTSVGLTITGDSIGVTGSPITTSGTLALAFAGTGAQYIKGDGTLATFPTTIAQAQNLITEVYNSTGATLTKGTIVYINGGQGNLPTVTKALATGDSTSAQTYGVVQTDITNMNNGFVVVAGRLLDIDTQAYTAGTQLYLSPTTAGTWTSTKPYAPNHLVYVGIVVRAHPTQGVIEVKIQNGYELDELHNVAAQNPDNNDILQYKTATSLWTKVAGTTSNISEGSNLYYTDARSRAALSFTAGSGAYNSTTGVITIPTNTNQLTNGAAFITLASLSAGAGISYNNTTGVIASTITQYTDAMARASISGGTGISYNSTTGVITNTITQYTDALARAAISLTTTGTSGAATYNSTTGVLNVPQYAPDLSGYVPTSRTLTINGTAYDLSANRSWSVGTVTSVGLSSATSGVTIGSTPITTSGTITLAIATASGSQQGLLSSTDWTTFNNKQSALTNPVTGTGTTNYLPKFTGTSTIGDSAIFDNSGNILIGATTNSEGAKLKIAGGYVYLKETGGADVYLRSAYDTNKAAIQVASASDLVFVTSNTTRLTLTASGNLGLGVTPSAWNSNSKALQLPSFISLSQQNSGALNLMSYAYESSANTFTYGATGVYATRLSMNPNDGVIAFYNSTTGTAGNAISFTQAMTLNASGNLALGGTSNKVTGLSGGGTGFTVQATAAPTIGVWDNSDASYYLQLGQIEANSYLWNIANGFLSFGTANTERMRLNASGNLGLGVTPSAWGSNVTALELPQSVSLYSWNASAVPQLYLGANHYWDGSTWRYKITGQASTLYYQAVGQHQWFNAPIGTAGNAISFTQAMTLDASGNLSLGTTSANRRLTIGGTSNAYMSFNASSNRNTTIGSDGFGNFIIYDDTASAYRMVVNSSGNVGIGTTSPSEKLHLQDATTGYVGLRLEGTGVYAGTDWTMYASSTSPSTANDFLGFYNNSTTDGAVAGYKMSILKNGNVGIGTTSPGTTLDISVAEASLRLTSTTGTNFTNQRIVNTGGTLWSGIERSTGGVLGITGAYEAFLLYGADNPMYIGTGNSFLRFGTNSTERMRITSGGEVAIGRTDAGGGRLGVRSGGNTSAANAFYVDNSSSTELFSVRNDGLIRSGAAAASPYNNSTTGRIMVIESGGGLGYTSALTIASTGLATFTGDVKVKTLEITNVGTYGSSSGISTYMQITVNGQNYVIPLHGTP